MTVLIRLICCIAFCCMASNFDANNSLVLMVVAIVMVGWSFLSLMGSFWNYINGSYNSIPSNVASFFSKVWGDESYDYDYYNGSYRYDKRHQRTFTQTVDTLKTLKEKMKIANTQMTIVSEEVKTTDVDGVPLVHNEPKQVTTTNVTVDTYEVGEVKDSNNNALIIYNNVTFTKMQKKVYQTIIDFLTKTLNDKKLMYYIINSIYHIDAMEDNVCIYYKKSSSRFIYREYKLPIDEMRKAICFACDNKTLNVEFIEMQTKELIDYYVETTLKSV